MSPIRLIAIASLAVMVASALAAETMTGVNGLRVFGLPGDRVVAVLKKYGRMK
jgi:D-aminopeptidase